MNTDNTPTPNTPTLDLNSYFPSEGTLSPYKLCKITNVILSDLGVDKTLPPQMFYNYTKNGMITGTKGEKEITPTQGQKWVEKYLTKNYSNK